jgi:hypothetical protein
MKSKTVLRFLPLLCCLVSASRAAPLQPAITITTEGYWLRCDAAYENFDWDNVYTWSRVGDAAILTNPTATDNAIVRFTNAGQALLITLANAACKDLLLLGSEYVNGTPITPASTYAANLSIPAGNSLNVSGNAVLSVFGSGTTTLLSVARGLSANLIVSGNLVLADASSADHTLNLSGNLHVSSNAILGNDGNASLILNRSGNVPRLTVNGNLIFARTPSSTATYSEITGSAIPAITINGAATFGAAGNLSFNAPASRFTTAGNVIIGDTSPGTSFTIGSAFIAANSSASARLVVANTAASGVTLLVSSGGSLSSGPAATPRPLVLGLNGALTAVNYGSIVASSLTLGQRASAARDVSLANSGSISAASLVLAPDSNGGNVSLSNGGNLTVSGNLSLACPTTTASPNASLVNTASGNLTADFILLANSSSALLGTGNAILVNHGNITANATLNLADTFADFDVRGTALPANITLVNHGNITENATGAAPADNYRFITNNASSRLVIENHGSLKFTSPNRGFFFDPASFSNHPGASFSISLAGSDILGNGIYFGYLANLPSRSINNAGTIEFNAKNVYIGSNLTLTLTNAPAGNLTASDTLILAGSTNANLTLVNSGNISASTLEIASSAGRAHITNSGNISASYLYLAGLHSTNPNGLTLVNSGNITATNFYIARGGVVSITNSGNISAPQSVIAIGGQSDSSAPDLAPNLTLVNNPGGTLRFGDNNLARLEVAPRSGAVSTLTNNASFIVLGSLYLGGNSSTPDLGTVSLTNDTGGSITIGGSTVRLDTASSLANRGSITPTSASTNLLLNGSTDNHGTLGSAENPFNATTFNATTSAVTLHPGSRLFTKNLTAADAPFKFIITEDSATLPANASVTLTAASQPTFNTSSANLIIDATALTYTATYPLFKTTGSGAAIPAATFLTSTGTSAALAWNTDGSVLSLVFTGQPAPTPFDVTALTPDDFLAYAFIPGNAEVVPDTGGSTAHLPVTTISGGTLSITFTPARSELTYEVQRSTDLQTWETIETVPGISIPVTINSNLPLTNAPRQFLRVKVSAP